MRHARDDYRFIVDLRTIPRETLDELLRDAIHHQAGGIPLHEPVFLLRGQDSCTPLAIAAWVEAARMLGAHRIAGVAGGWLEHVRAWQMNNVAKTPDLPGGGG